MGDYVDRGPDTCGVLEMLRALAEQCRLVPLLGNHDEMMLKVCAGRTDLFGDWLVFGGNATLASYHTLLPEGVWRKHLDFLETCRLFYETERHFFVHANYRNDLPLANQPRDVLIWESLKRRQPSPHYSARRPSWATRLRRAETSSTSLGEVHRHVVLRRGLAYRDGRRVGPEFGRPTERASCEPMKTAGREPGHSYGRDALAGPRSPVQDVHPLRRWLRSLPQRAAFDWHRLPRRETGRPERRRPD